MLCHSVLQSLWHWHKVQNRQLKCPLEHPGEKRNQMYILDLWFSCVYCVPTMCQALWFTNQISLTSAPPTMSHTASLVWLKELATWSHASDVVVLKSKIAILTETLKYTCKWEVCYLFWKIQCRVLYAVGAWALEFWSNCGSIAFLLICP